MFVKRVENIGYLKIPLSVLEQRRPLLNPVVDFVEGPTALVFSYKDPVEIAKALKEFIKTHPTLEIKGLVMQGKGYDAKVIDEFVKLPPKEVLLAQVLGTIQAPVSNFVGLLSAILRNFLYVLKAIEEKKGKGEA